MDADLDALIIGGGPAGLTAAIYLGRFRRRFMVADGGESRLGLIPITHNHPGFQDGVEGAVLLARMRAQAERFGAVILPQPVAALRRESDAFVAEVDGGSIRTPYVILATGVEDRASTPDFRRAIREALIRICPICDGYEVIGQDVGVIGVGAHGAREALFLNDYGRRITLLNAGPRADIDDASLRALAAAGIEVIDAEVRAVSRETDQSIVLALADGRGLSFGAVYSALGTTPRTQLAASLHVRTNEAGCVVVDEHQRTSLDGLYAAGDLVRGLNQISVAEAEAAIAATDIHNRLKG